MAQISIVVPDSIVPRLIAAVEARLGTRKQDGTLEVSGAPLVKKALVDFLRCHLRDYEVMLAEASAHKSEFDKVSLDASGIG